MGVKCMHWHKEKYTFVRYIANSWEAVVRTNAKNPYSVSYMACSWKMGVKTDSSDRKKQVFLYQSGMQTDLNSGINQKKKKYEKTTTQKF